MRDASSKVDHVDVLGIIGHNVAGKRTLLKKISHVTAPISGKVKVKGRVASLLEGCTIFHPEFPGRENIYLKGVILGIDRCEIAGRREGISSRSRRPDKAWAYSFLPNTNSNTVKTAQMIVGGPTSAKVYMPEIS